MFLFLRLDFHATIARAAKATQYGCLFFFVMCSMDGHAWTWHMECLCLILESWCIDQKNVNAAYARLQLMAHVVATCTCQWVVCVRNDGSESHVDMLLHGCCSCIHDFSVHMPCHLYFIYTSFIHHLYNIYTSFKHHFYNIYTLIIHHLYNIYTSFIQHLYIIYTTFIH
jgi:hypothetical protein